jgi:DNA-directed RNA polymerase specialized sigma24 family protein
LKAEGYSLAKIAKELRLPVGTIRSRYRLAKQHMNRKMRKSAARSDMK